MGPLLSESALFDALREGMWTAAIASGPILAVTLAVGLAVGLLQALTSVQEATLTFVPKLAAIVGTFWITMGFMTDALVGLFQGTLVPLIAGV